ncbi:nitroreductase [Motiliproteus coralliicola]|uniref:Putative NAD(P)H nitroreductase n=1 Tax=Motiliproteus coralliicola TaxID=2283196 RepID=A0A369WQE3_9GAMM|nr:nitroreductase [Motiliproteus coralliicola]RDE22834.1 nitroreductase [Motiliproteus coralliicola]
MDALELLHNRVSSPMLGDQPPTEEQLQNMFQAAVRAPDHGALRPWRFLTVAGNDRAKLGELFLAAGLADEPEMSEAKQNKLRNMPLRAPMLVVAIAKIQPHPKVPEVEQQIAAGAATQNLLLAAFAQGVGGMWRTGDMAYNTQVMEGLGLAEDEQIIGFVYLGSQPEKMKTLCPLDPADYVQGWPGA